MKRMWIGGMLLLSCAIHAEPGSPQTGTGPSSWSDATLSSLQSAGDANALFAAHLLARWRQDSRADEFLAQAYDRGQEDPKVLWYASVSALCTVSRPKDCERSVQAARQLTVTDSANAMAWLTLAWAADRQLHASGNAQPELIKQGLRSAALAKVFHDYGFDLTRVFVRETGRVPITALSRDAVQTQAEENGRLTVAMMVGQSGQEVVSWLRAGCGVASSAGGDVAPLCNSAKTLLGRGDSVRTLSAEPSKAEAVSAALSKGNEAGPDPASHTRFLIEAIAASQSESELADRLGKQAK